MTSVFVSADLMLKDGIGPLIIYCGTDLYRFVVLNVYGGHGVQVYARRQ